MLYGEWWMFLHTHSHGLQHLSVFQVRNFYEYYIYCRPELSAGLLSEQHNLVWMMMDGMKLCGNKTGKQTERYQEKSRKESEWMSAQRNALIMMTQIMKMVLTILLLCILYTTPTAQSSSPHTMNKQSANIECSIWIQNCFVCYLILSLSGWTKCNGTVYMKLRVLFWSGAVQIFSCQYRKQYGNFPFRNCQLNVLYVCLRLLLIFPIKLSLVHGIIVDEITIFHTQFDRKI